MKRILWIALFIAASAVGSARAADGPALESLKQLASGECPPERCFDGRPAAAQPGVSARLKREAVNPGIAATTSTGLQVSAPGPKPLPRFPSNREIEEMAMKGGGVPMAIAGVAGGVWGFIFAGPLGALAGALAGLAIVAVPALFLAYGIACVRWVWQRTKAR